MQNHQYKPLKYVKHWRDEEDRFFLEYTLKFERPLTEAEKIAVLRHYLDGLELFDTDKILRLIATDTSKDDVYKITFHQSDTDRNRVLFGLYVSLKDKFPFDLYGTE